MTPEDLLAALDPDQREAAAHTQGPLRILAGAGSGKTRTITHRIAVQVATGAVAPQQVLAVTFTERAAAELKARLAGLGIGTPVRAATFHAAAWAQVRYFWPRTRAEPLPEVLPSKARLLGRDARRLRLDVSDLAAEIEWAKARMLDADGYARAAAAHGREPPADPKVLAAAYRRYEDAKAAAGLLDYEDMLLVALDLLRDAEIAAAVRDRYRAFTVDEFQDVNPAQWALLRAWVGDRDDVCVVGDPDQTIFSFTGADAGFLQRFADAFPGTVTVRLTRCYRCSRQVLAVANRVRRPGPTSPGALVATSGDGPAVAFAEHPDDAAERAGVVAGVRSLLAAGVAAGQIAVCTRTNALTAPLEEALREAGIDCVVRGAGGFYTRKAVRDALRALAAGAGEPVDDPDGPPALGTRAAPPDPLRRAARILRRDLAFREDHPPAGAAERERWEEVAEVLAALRRAAATRPDADLASLVAVLQARAAPTGPAATDAVTLMSLHKAKGTEFDAVFLVGLEEGLLPIVYAKSDADVAEERRLLYVGITRARRHLTLSWARSRLSPSGREMARRPSRFLYGLGPGAPQPARKATRRTPAAVDTADPLTARLREWRRERATCDGVPAYVVFDDATMAALAAARPRTRTALAAVPGFGPKRLERYADAVLALVADASEPDPDPSPNGGAA